MHMTSQKGAQLRWGSNETLPRASSQACSQGGKPCKPHHWAGRPARARALRGLSANAHCQHNNVARCATLDWRRCYGDVTLCDVNA